MASRNRRLTEASVYRYAFKRAKWNLSTFSGDELGQSLIKSDAVVKAVVRAGLAESINWYTDYALYHKAKQVAKEIAENEGVPGAVQGLLMAFAERVLANYFVDKKQVTLADLIWDYTRKLMEYAVVPRTGFPMAYLRAGRKRILIPDLLLKIAVQIGKMLNVPESVVKAEASANRLNV